MVAKKGKRKIEYEGNIFYWFVRADDNGRLRIHILSELCAAQCILFCTCLKNRMELSALGS